MPQVHLFGHIHEQRGHWDRTIFPGEQGDARCRLVDFLTLDEFDDFCYFSLFWRLHNGQFPSYQ